MGRRKKETIMREIKSKEKKENKLFDLIDNNNTENININNNNNKLIKIKIILGYNILQKHNVEYAKYLKEYLCNKEHYTLDDEEKIYDEDNSVMLEEYIIDSIPGLENNQDIRVVVNRPYEELDMIEDTTIEFIGISGKSDFASAIMTELPLYILEIQKKEDFLSFLKGKDYLDYFEDDEIEENDDYNLDYDPD